MTIVVLVDPMTTCAVPVNIDPRIASMRMISFVLIVDVSKVVDAMPIPIVFSLQMNTSVIGEVH